MGGNRRGNTAKASRSGTPDEDIWPPYGAYFSASLTEAFSNLPLLFKDDWSIYEFAVSLGYKYCVIQRQILLRYFVKWDRQVEVDITIWAQT